MKYIWKNFKTFFQTDFYLMFLLVFTIVISGIMIHYAYAMYINFQEKKKEGTSVLTDINFDFDYTYGQGTFKMERGKYSEEIISYVRPEGELATVGMLKDFAAAMSYELQSEIESASVEVEIDSIPIG